MSLRTRCNRVVFTPPPPRVFPADGFLSALIKSVFIIHIYIGVLERALFFPRTRFRIVAIH